MGYTMSNVGGLLASKQKLHDSNKRQATSRFRQAPKSVQKQREKREGEIGV